MFVLSLLPQPALAVTINSPIFPPPPVPLGPLGRQGARSRKHGIDATVIFISGSVRGIQSILAGEIAIGEGGGPGLASARLAGGDVVAIAGNVNVLPYYLVAQPAIKKHEDLRGKIGGTHIAGTTAEFALKVGLKRIGLDPLKDVNLRVIGGAIERMVALQKGIVNFTVVTEAGKAMAEKLGYPTVVDMVTLQIPFPQNGIYTSTKLTRENPEFVRRYLRAYVEAIHYYKPQKTRSRFAQVFAARRPKSAREWGMAHEIPWPGAVPPRMAPSVSKTWPKKPKAAQAKSKLDRPRFARN